MLSIVQLDFDSVLGNKDNKKPIVYSKGKIIGKNEQPNKLKMIIQKSSNKPRIQTAKAYIGKRHQSRPVLHALANYNEEDDYDDIEDDENRYIGNILSNAFTQSEIDNREDISPSPKINMNKAKQKEQRTIPNQSLIKPITKPKPNTYFIEDTTAILMPLNSPNNPSEPKQISEKELKQTIKRFEESNAIEHKINTVLKEGFLSKPQDTTSTVIPNNTLIRINPEQNEAIEKKANEDIQRIGLTCNNLIKYTKDLDHQLKEDMKSLHQFPIHKEFNEEKGLALVKGVKDDIKATPSFDVNSLNAKDKRLMTSKLNYHPKPRQPINNLHHNDEQYANRIKKTNDLLNKSSKLIRSAKGKGRGIRNQITKHKALDDKAEHIKLQGQFEEYISTAYQNLFNKGKDVNIRDIQRETHKEVETKEDIYEYHYLKEQEQEDICYYHPFLADGGML